MPLAAFWKNDCIPLIPEVNQGCPFLDGGPLHER
jgi:hypothetical protein